MSVPKSVLLAEIKCQSLSRAQLFAMENSRSYSLVHVKSFLKWHISDVDSTESFYAVLHHQLSYDTGIED